MVHAMIVAALFTTGMSPLAGGDGGAKAGSPRIPLMIEPVHSEFDPSSYLSKVEMRVVQA